MPRLKVDEHLARFEIDDTQTADGVLVAGPIKDGLDLGRNRCRVGRMLCARLPDSRTQERYISGQSGETILHLLISIQLLNDYRYCAFVLYHIDDIRDIG